MQIVVCDTVYWFARTSSGNNKTVFALFSSSLENYNLPLKCNWRSHLTEKERWLVVVIMRRCCHFADFLLIYIYYVNDTEKHHLTAHTRCFAHIKNTFSAHTRSGASEATINVSALEERRRWTEATKIQLIQKINDNDDNISITRVAKWLSPKERRASKTEMWMKRVCLHASRDECDLKLTRPANWIPCEWRKKRPEIATPEMNGILVWFALFDWNQSRIAFP